jgi:uncharacterized membrane protein
LTEEKGLARYIWVVILILAVVLLGMASILIAMPTHILDYILEMSGSSLTMGSLDKEAIAAFSFVWRGLSMSGVWFGIFGLFCAWGIKRKESFAWKLGVLWGVLLIVAGITTAVNELLVLRWSTVCQNVTLNVIVGAIALGCLFAVRKKFL